MLSKMKLKEWELYTISDKRHPGQQTNQAQLGSLTRT